MSYQLVPHGVLPQGIVPQGLVAQNMVAAGGLPVVGGAAGALPAALPAGLRAIPASAASIGGIIPAGRAGILAAAPGMPALRPVLATPRAAITAQPQLRGAMIPAAAAAAAAVARQPIVMTRPMSPQLGMQGVVSTPYTSSVVASSPPPAAAVMSVASLMSLGGGVTSSSAAQAVPVMPGLPAGVPGGLVRPTVYMMPGGGLATGPNPLGLAGLAPGALPLAASPAALPQAITPASLQPGISPGPGGQSDGESDTKATDPTLAAAIANYQGQAAIQTSSGLVALPQAPHLPGLQPHLMAATPSLVQQPGVDVQALQMHHLQQLQLQQQAAAVAGLQPVTAGALQQQAALQSQWAEAAALKAEEQSDVQANGTYADLAVMPAEVEERERDPDEPNVGPETVVLDHFNSDLNLQISKDGYSGEALTHPTGFCFCWAGARATYGVSKGMVCFEVLIAEHLPVDFGEDHQETDPHIVRVGWSMDTTSFQLGEEANSYGYGGTGKFATGGKFKSFGERFGKGDVITAMIDYTAHPAPRLTYMKNGRWLGVACSLQGVKVGEREHAMFPHILSKNCRFEVNFGQREPYYPPPSGFKFPEQLSMDELIRATEAPSHKADCEIIMIVGLPGAGKTTWAQKQFEENPDKRYNIIGTDTLIDKMKVMGLPRKNNYHGRWDVLIQKATNCLNKLFQIGCKRRRNYILDQTNVYASARRRKMKNFVGFRRVCVVLQPSDNELKRREWKRTHEDGKFVPEDAVLEMKANYSLPQDTDQFVDEIRFIEMERDDAQKLINQYNTEGTEKRPSKDGSRFGGRVGAGGKPWDSSWGQHGWQQGEGGKRARHDSQSSGLDFIKREYEESQAAAAAGDGYSASNSWPPNAKNAPSGGYPSQDSYGYPGQPPAGSSSYSWPPGADASRSDYYSNYTSTTTATSSASQWSSYGSDAYSGYQAGQEGGYTAAKTDQGQYGYGSGYDSSQAYYSQRSDSDSKDKEKSSWDGRSGYDGQTGDRSAEWSQWGYGSSAAAKSDKWSGQSGYGEGGSGSPSQWNNRQAAPPQAAWSQSSQGRDSQFRQNTDSWENKSSPAPGTERPEDIQKERKSRWENSTSSEASTSQASSKAGSDTVSVSQGSLLGSPPKESPAYSSSGPKPGLLGEKPVNENGPPPPGSHAVPPHPMPGPPPPGYPGGPPPPHGYPPHLPDRPPFPPRPPLRGMPIPRPPFGGPRGGPPPRPPMRPPFPPRGGPPPPGARMPPRGPPRGPPPPHMGRGGPPPPPRWPRHPPGPPGPRFR